MKHLKSEFDKLSFKDALVYSMAYVSLATGYVMLFVGMFTDPEGEIHDSVLYAYGLTLLFVGSLLGISMRYAGEVEKFKGSIVDLLKGYGIQPVSSEHRQPEPKRVADDEPIDECSGAEEDVGSRHGVSRISFGK